MITTGGLPQWRSSSRSSSISNTVDDASDPFKAAGVLRPRFFPDLVSVSGEELFSTELRDFRGVPRFVGDRNCRQLSSELCIAVLAAKGDANSFECDTILAKVLAGETGNWIVLEFPLSSSWRCNTTAGWFIDGVLASEMGDADDAKFSWSATDFDFLKKRLSESGMFSGEEFTPVGEWHGFGTVPICCNFWGTAPLRRLALEPAGDAGYFRGDLFDGGIISGRFRFSESGTFSGEEFTPVGEWLCCGSVPICCNLWGVVPLRRPALEPAGDAGYFRGDLFDGGVIFGHFRFSESGMFSGEEFIPVGEWLSCGSVPICCNFWGVVPLRRPALEPAGDAGYFRGDLLDGGVIFGHFAGVPADVLADIRFNGEDGAFVPAPFSLWQFLIVSASEDSVCKKQAYNTTKMTMTTFYVCLIGLLSWSYSR